MDIFEKAKKLGISGDSSYGLGGFQEFCRKVEEEWANERKRKIERNFAIAILICLLNILFLRFFT
jgi:hypothetical protein